MDVVEIIIVSAIAAVLFFGGMFIGSVHMQTEAVNNGAAYWCIVDHGKVFSWEPCEEF